MSTIWGRSKIEVGALSSATSRPRLEAVDLVRGIVMVLMVLDHTRDYFGDMSISATDLSKATPALFLTRWVTHFCAPAFAFLAGVSIYLAGIRGMSRSRLATYVLTRGLWLIFLELTVIRFGMSFNPAPRFFTLIVIWALGGSFVLMSCMVFLPSRVVGAVGVLLIATNQLIGLGAFGPGSSGLSQALSTILLQPGLVRLPGDITVMVGYPLLPWFGVVAAGYGFGEVFQLEPNRRRSLMVWLGLGLVVAFLALRAWGGFGELSPWVTQRTPLLTALEFINCTKYPPSLLYLLMTLGPTVVTLAVCDRVGAGGPIGRALVTLGRVPLFYYILQWYIIHGLAVVAALIRGFPVGWMFSLPGQNAAPPDWPLSLPALYAVWVAVVVLLYVPCRSFAEVKRRHPGGWLSYL